MTFILNEVTLKVKLNSFLNKFTVFFNVLWYNNLGILVLRSIQMKKLEQSQLLEIFIFAIAMILSVIGIMSVYTAGSYVASIVIQDPFYYVKRQAMFLALGLVICVATMTIKYRFFTNVTLLKRFAGGIMIILIGLLFFGTPVNGAKGWLNLGLFNFQPLEIAKLILIWMTAFYFAEGRYLPELPIPEQASKGIKFWCQHHQEVTLGLVYSGILLTVLLQPDTGGFAIMLGTLILIWLSSGIFPWKKALKWLGIGFAALISFVVLLANTIGTSDYRVLRILVFLNPFNSSADASRQIRNSFYALARGGITGVGLGNSVQKTGYLAEFHTDFILSIIGEELGIFGVIFVTVLLFILVYLIFKRSLTVKRVFDKFVLLGIAILFMIQISLNIAGVTSMAPLTGVTLPFISYGGSSLIASFISIGIVLKISMYDRKNNRESIKYDETN
ncbi:FtsW/RodA/SpoVE family cell cycle protein [Granulicatella sp. zg-84]|nr:FtsW/RodA/SpoVE family cell cycle protein [Granulicatella sp. zg-84]